MEKEILGVGRFFEHPRTSTPPDSLPSSLHLPPFTPRPTFPVMLVLSESSIGFAIFSVTDEGRIGQDDLYKSFESPEAANNLFVSILLPSSLILVSSLSLASPAKDLHLFLACRTKMGQETSLRAQGTRSVLVEKLRADDLFLLALSLGLFTHLPPICD